MGAPRFIFGDEFSPGDLFLAGTQGAWYDPSDFGTLFQDAAGTTPVTAVEQPVGAMLDKRALLYSTNFASATNITTPDSANLQFTARIGTVECWVYLPAAVTVNFSGLIDKWVSPGAGYMLDFGSATLGNLGKIRASIGAATPIVSTNTIPVTTWTHVALVCDGTNATLYIDGQSQGSVNISTQDASASGEQLAINGDNASTLRSPCIVSNVRIVKGTAVYTGNFTPPTSQLTAISGTSLLTCGVTWTGNPALTNNGGVASGLSPFSATTVGNHAYQTTAASRPTLRARYNLLTQSEDFSQAVWTKTNVTVTANSDTAPDGTLTADTLAATAGNGTTLGSFTALAASYTFSVYLKRKTGTGNVDISADGSTYTTQTITSSWARYTVTQTLTAGAKTPGIRIATNGDEVYAWGAQLLGASDVTATGNAYQAIAAATSYTTGGVFRPYLAFDGVDDALGTASIDFTAKDEVSVFAGVTKQSDTAQAVVAELSASANSNSGTWYLLAPLTTGASGDYGWKSRGTVNSAGVGGAVVLAPNTSVFTGLGDISTDLKTLARNGAAYASGTTDQGSGNFGNYPMYIGSRAGTTLPFNGRIYSLIVRGAASTVAEISETEAWVNGKTGAY